VAGDREQAFPHEPFALKIAAPLCASAVEIFQVNVGNRCNLACRHCHVDAGPGCTEVMSRAILERCLEILGASTIPTIDITGGSPEMHPDIRWFLRECAALGRRLLVRSFNAAALANIMCRTTVSVGWDGTLYDCDFNQMLRIPINHGAPDNVMAFDLDALNKRQIVVGNHCYGCTAGAGSSCQGEVV